jgi:hypothetical protein
MRAHAVRHFDELEVTLLAQFHPDQLRPSLREWEIVSTFLPGKYPVWSTNVGEVSHFWGTPGLRREHQSPKRSAAASIQCASHRPNTLFCLNFCSFVDELFEEATHAPCYSKTAPEAQRVTLRGITPISTQPKPPTRPTGFLFLPNV